MATVKLTELMKERQLLSFELFPPKTDKGMENLPGTIEHLCEFKPEYISVTYGAGGGNVGTNREVCQMVKKAGAVPVTHFTVIKNTKEGIKDHLETYLSEGVDHILSLIHISVSTYTEKKYKKVPLSERQLRQGRVTR